jgi:RNA polymerase sigma-70 factor (ECF subfamily)
MAGKEKADPQQWVASYADFLYAFALKRIQDPEVSKDLLQDTFMAGIKNISNFKGISSEKTWLTSILKNKIIDYYRKKACEIMVSDTVTATIQDDKFFESNGHWKLQYFPEKWSIEETGYVENKELKRVLERCIKKLPVLWSMVFNLKYLEEEDSKKICKELGISASNFWVIIHRSKVSLRECISDNWLK